MRIAKLASCLAFVFCALFSSTAARAATYNFSFDYINPALKDFSFQLPSSPGGPGFVGGDFFILVSDVVDNNGAFYDSIVFYDGASGGGLEAILNNGNPDPFNFTGPQLFAAAPEGPDNRYLHPTFVLGTYVLGDFFADPNAPPVGTLTITAVPELSTWAMLIIGFAGVGLVCHRRNRLVAS